MMNIQKGVKFVVGANMKSLAVGKSVYSFDHPVVLGSDPMPTYSLGQNDPYKSLKTTLKAEIDEEAW